MNIADVFFKAQLDDGQLLIDAKKSGDKMGQTMGGSLSATLKKAAAGAALGGVFTSAIEGATRFEDQLRTINTVAKVSDEQLSAIGNDIQQLSRDSGKTTDDLTAGFYDLVSAGVPAGEAMKVLKDSSILATGALGTTSEAVDLVTSALGAYGLSADKSTRVTDIFAQAVADGKTTVADLAGGISQVAPIAASAGVSLEEVAAATAVMTLKGDTASQAMTRIKNAINALLTPNATLNEITKRTGINFAELAKDKGLAVALEELRKATNGNNEEFAKALGSSEALTLAFSVTGDNAGAMATELGKVQAGADKGGVALEQYAEKSKSAAEQGKRLVANIQTFLQDVGGPFVSTMGPAVFALNQMGQAFGAGGIAAKAFGAILGGSLASKLKGLEIGTRLQTLFIKGMTKIVDPIADALTTAVSGAWQKVAGSSKVSGAIDKAGSFMGSKLGKALSVAFAAVAVFEVIDTYNKVKAEAEAQGAAIGTAIGEQITSGTTEQLKQSRAAVAQGLADLMNIPDFGIVTGDSRKRLEAELARLDATITSREASLEADAARLGPAINDGLERAASSVDGKPITEAVTDITALALKTAGQIAAGVSKAQGNRLGASIAQGIREKRDAVDSSWNLLLDTIHNAMKPAAERAKLLGRLTSNELIWGLKSKDPAVRAQAAATKQVILDRLAELGANAKNIGKTGMDALRKAMKSKDPDIRAAALAIYNAATKKPSTIPAAMTGYGYAAGKAYADGLRSTYGLVNDAAHYVAKGAVGPLEASSPPGPESPLHLIDKWGEKTIAAYASGMLAAGDRVKAAAMAVVGGAANAFIPRTLANAVPAMGGVPVAAGAQAYQAVAGGVVNNYYNTANVEGLVKAPDPLSIARELGRSARNGQFRPKAPV